MPNYDYGCPDCGMFSMSRPMAEYDRPQDCPDCGAASHRVLAVMPAIAGMDAGRRTAISTNERSAHAPRLSSAGGAHSPGCGCCKTAGGATKLSADGAKSFPSRRPWMISH
jgi:putative FmdB family regulatory protein